jgi:hypothetical protein
MLRLLCIKKNWLCLAELSHNCASDPGKMGCQLIIDYALLKTLGGTPDNHQVVS